MVFYTKQHRYFCGIDLHTKNMYVCIIDHDGKVCLHKNLPVTREAFLMAIEPFREDICVAVESTFSWYWLADLCMAEGIEFVLGHALYLKAIHGGKTKNDRIDSHKLAVILRGGMFPIGYVYPQEMRAARDLMRRRMHMVNHRANLLAHVQNTNSQYNLGPFPKRLSYQSNRCGVADRFSDPCVHKSVSVDLHLIDCYDETLRDLELHIVKAARHHDPQTLHLLKTIPGIGKILSLVILYEIHDIHRFERVQNFLSYSRLVKPQRESGGKRYPGKNSKIGNVHLKWAFSEAAVLFLRGNETFEKTFNRWVSKYGKPKALSILASKLGRAVYFMLKRNEAFNMEKFMNRA
jgi:transposase